jgi:hypothetical protein
MFCMYFKCGNFNAPISAEGCLISTLIFHPLMRDILDSQVFNSCIAASSFQNGPALIHNCALNGNATFTEEIDCQTNWVPPILPAFNASKSSFLSTVLDAGITTPPQPGQTYNLSPTGLWGEARTGISAAYFGSTYPPEITSQPSDSTKIVGQTASFSVTANANPSPTSYVWRLNVTPLVNGGRISGVDTTALTITSLISGDAGNYSIIIANGISPDTTSNDATLVVNPIPPAVNTFIPFPARDGTQVISTINAATLMPMLSEDSIYFATINDVYKVYLYFTDQDGRQLKRIIHDGTALSGPAIWTSVAKAGIWQLEKIKVFDREGALHSFGRDNSSSDFTLV